MHQLQFKENQIQKIQPDMLQRMEKIVRTGIRHTKFYSDFYLDLNFMRNYNLNLFVWFVYDCGTNLIPFTEVDIGSFQNEWLSTIDDFKIQKSNDSGRLYLCNVQEGSITRINGYKTGNLYLKLKALI
ncbi:hypothetical protein JI735_34110 (plasmid) [Paenibacillus sonchi]|uniref:Uncharacterized protein n=1 Tax=Paenibacillus sonchi TaxID=373687 RepID=A0A974PJ89_9BACL|nr:hypothetical protein [Paenibacillus sonchi]QQZ64476.1 hypothetical protein JI735_34110 [Paenibacillus sonchi]